MRFAAISAPLAWIFFAGCAIAHAEDVQVRLVNDRLQLSAPRLRFVTGKPLEQLRNGSSVAFDIQVSVLTDSRQTVLLRSFERFVFSYDLWEERFSVTSLRSNRSSAGHLTAPAAEAWCLGRFSLVTAALPADKQLWVRVDVHAGEGRDKRTPEDDEEGFSLANLIDLFSRQGKSRDASRWRAESASFTLASLRADRQSP